MILVILGVSIVLVVAGVIIYDKTFNEAAGCAMIMVGAAAGVVSLVVAIVLCCVVSGDYRIDEKIAMYTEENAKIEQQIAECVEQYQEYEQGIVESVNPSSSVTLVSLYPDLKADTLVKKQIETYVSNNNKLIELKERKIQAKVSKWWLYFG